jgi:hypothetical protein
VPIYAPAHCPSLYSPVDACNTAGREGVSYSGLRVPEDKNSVFAGAQLSENGAAVINAAVRAVTLSTLSFFMAFCFLD